MVEGPSRFMVKPCTPLNGILDANISDWIIEWEQSQLTEPSVNGKKRSAKKSKGSNHAAGGR
jgi:hypothetical protein